MIMFDELIRRIAGLDPNELSRWVDNSWVRPERQGTTWLFHEVDVARVELIVEIRDEFAIDDEALPVILGLLDEVYSLRRQMRRLCAAVADQPSEIRDAIQRALPYRRDEPPKDR